MEAGANAFVLKPLPCGAYALKKELSLLLNLDQQTEREFCIDETIELMDDKQTKTMGSIAKINSEKKTGLAKREDERVVFGTIIGSGKNEKIMECKPNTKITANAGNLVATTNVDSSTTTLDCLYRNGSVTDEAICALIRDSNIPVVSLAPVSDVQTAIQADLSDMTSGQVDGAPATQTETQASTGISEERNRRKFVNAAAGKDVRTDSTPANQAVASDLDKTAGAEEVSLVSIHEEMNDATFQSAVNEPPSDTDTGNNNAMADEEDDIAMANTTAKMKNSCEWEWDRGSAAETEARRKKKQENDTKEGSRNKKDEKGSKKNKEGSAAIPDEITVPDISTSRKLLPIPKRRRKQMPGRKYGERGRQRTTRRSR